MDHRVRIPVSRRRRRLAAAALVALAATAGTPGTPAVAATTTGVTAAAGTTTATAAYPRQADLWSLGPTGFLTWPAEGFEPARDKSGVLWLYKGRGDHTFSARIQIGGARTTGSPAAAT